MATACVNTDCRCGFCKYEFLDMTNPRVLTCGHIHCKSCLILAMEGYKEVELACPYCKEMVKQSDVDGLEKVPQSDVNGDKVTLTCDSERCDKKSAVSFCVDCNMKVCDTHQQFHDEMFGSRHEMISIKEYQESPGKYKKTFCEHQRKNTLVKACKQCYKMICKKCGGEECYCKAKTTKFSTEHVNFPSSLAHISTHDIENGCRSISHKPNGNVLVVDGVGGLCVLNKRTAAVTKLDAPFKQIYTAIEYRQAIYTLHTIDHTWKVNKSSLDFTQSEQLFEFENFDIYPIMSVSERYVVASKPVGKNGLDHLVIYNVNKKQCKTISNVGTISLSLLPDNTLLVRRVDSITRCKIHGKKLIEKWKWTELTNVHRVCIDVNGLIYASTHSNQQSIYIVSSLNGRMLKKIKYDKLPAVMSGQFSVRGNELVVPDCDHGKLHTFKLNY